MTLEAGDIIATGTPSGVGELKPGDQVEVEVAGVGTLSNHVIRASDSAFSTIDDGKLSLCE